MFESLFSLVARLLALDLDSARCAVLAQASASRRHRPVAGPRAAGPHMSPCSTFSPPSMQKVAMGKVYDSQRRLKATPSTLGEALAAYMRQQQQIAKDSLRELSEAVRARVWRCLCARVCAASLHPRFRGWCGSFPPSLASFESPRWKRVKRKRVVAARKVGVNKRKQGPLGHAARFHARPWKIQNRRGRRC